MKDKRPNILLLMTDQHRGDCLGVDGHPVQQTPYLDELALSGARFRKAYTACPVCIPARRTLMTGMKPASHGVLMNYNTHLEFPTLPGELAKAGYQTHLVGKLHLWPHRKLYGFMSADWSDGTGHPDSDDDYTRFLKKEGLGTPKVALAGGQNCNGWVSRPWHLDEKYHFTTWCADKALEFLERRDPTKPFFLKTSFIDPHQPCTPPRDYYERYMNMDLPEPPVADWARVFEEPQRGLPVASWRTCLDRQVMKQFMAGYYGCVNHIDNQIGRILQSIPKDTVIVFVSDHGEMLGDHQWIRKRSAYEGSARIPYIIRFPESFGLDRGQVRDEVVELMDIMPTLLDAADADIPDTVEGRSLLPLLRAEDDGWREYLHGECAEVPSLNSGQQYLTDGRHKYIWYPGTAREQLFDLENDPKEMEDLADDPGMRGEIEKWRERLVDELGGRNEGFVKDGKLQRLGGPTPFALPDWI